MWGLRGWLRHTRRRLFPSPLIAMTAAQKRGPSGTAARPDDSSDDEADTEGEENSV